MTEARRFANFPRRLSRLTLVSLALLGACQLHSDHAAPVADRAPDSGAVALAPVPAGPAARPQPVVVTLTPPIPSAAVALDARLRHLGAAFNGEVGLAVRDVATGWTSHYHGLNYFPQQSVSKLWVALSLLDRVD